MGCNREERENVSHNYTATANENSQQAFNLQMEKLYRRWAQEDVRVEEYRVEDAEFVFAAYGTSGGVCKSVVNALREQGVRPAS